MAGFFIDECEVEIRPAILQIRADVQLDVRRVSGELECGSDERGLGFRARFKSVVLLKDVAAAGDEFLVVQGFVDLAVILPEEIWLVDFKTDEASGSELIEKVKFYEPQLKLYALALGRIYRRPVTESWLHLLALKKTIPVGAAA